MISDQDVTPKVLILVGDGLNCEQELARAFRLAGGKVIFCHVTEFISRPTLLLEVDIFAIPGGFSFGDELRSGKILAEKLRTPLMQLLPSFLDQGGLVLGVCNGFQVLMQLGVFESLDKTDYRVERQLTLTTNDHGEFRDLWTECFMDQAAQGSPWFHGIEANSSFVFPIRHKEGRLVINGKTAPGSHLGGARIAWRYSKDVNGSQDRIAALMDSTGQILGMMPHPEVALETFLFPQLSFTPPCSLQKINYYVGQNRQIFLNGINYKKFFSSAP